MKKIWKPAGNIITHIERKFLNVTRKNIGLAKKNHDKTAQKVEANMDKKIYMRQYRAKNKGKMAEYRKRYNEKKKKAPKCDVDCFNCKFDDCIK